LYNQQNGQHQWCSAPTGIAGNAITFTTRMTLNVSGNLGLGTASPTNRLHILNDGNTLAAFRITDTNANASSLVITASNVDSAIIANGTSAIPLDIYTGGVARLRVSATGNVGIGTSSPSAFTGYNGITTDGSTGGFYDLFSSGSRKGTFNTTASLVSIGSTSTQDFALLTNNAERMRITSAGNVGIGTSSPSTELHVVGSGKFTASAQIHRDGSDAVGSGPYFALVQTSNAKQWLMQMNGAQGLAFWAYTGSAWTTPVTFTNGGFVGLGSTAPDTKLTVLDTAGAKISIGGGSSQNGMTWQGVNGANSFYLFNGAISSQGWGLYNINTAAFPLWVSNASNISLGTTTDAGYRLYVSGAIYATSNITANSDLTLKKNLILVDNPIDKLKQLNGYLYQWKENDEYQYGVIAQEVEKILPYAVSTGRDGIKGVSYNQIIPVLIEAVKELNAELKLLKAK
jgi:hypothetical protein